MQPVTLRTMPKGKRIRKQKKRNTKTKSSSMVVCRLNCRYEVSGVIEDDEQSEYVGYLRVLKVIGMGTDDMSQEAGRRVTWK